MYDLTSTRYLLMFTDPRKLIVHNDLDHLNCTAPYFFSPFCGRPRRWSRC